MTHVRSVHFSGALNGSIWPNRFSRKSASLPEIGTDQPIKKMCHWHSQPTDLGRWWFQAGLQTFRNSNRFGSQLLRQDWDSFRKTRRLSGIKLLVAKNVYATHSPPLHRSGVNWTSLQLCQGESDFRMSSLDGSIALRHSQSSRLVPYKVDVSSTVSGWLKDFREWPIWTRIYTFTFAWSQTD